MGVGKSCLLHQFTEKKCEFYSKYGKSESPSSCRFVAPGLKDKLVEEPGNYSSVHIKKVQFTIYSAQKIALDLD